jgi:hypothetical protein
MDLSFNMARRVAMMTRLCQHISHLIVACLNLLQRMRLLRAAELIPGTKAIGVQAAAAAALIPIHRKQTRIYQVKLTRKPHTLKMI